MKMLFDALPLRLHFKGFWLLAARCTPGVPSSSQPPCLLWRCGYYTAQPSTHVSVFMWLSWLCHRQKVSQRPFIICLPLRQKGQSFLSSLCIMVPIPGMLLCALLPCLGVCDFKYGPFSSQSLTVKQGAKKPHKVVKALMWQLFFSFMRQRTSATEP